VGYREVLEIERTGVGFIQYAVSDVFASAPNVLTAQKCHPIDRSAQSRAIQHDKRAISLGAAQMNVARKISSAFQPCRSAKHCPQPWRTY